MTKKAHSRQLARWLGRINRTEILDPTIREMPAIGWGCRVRTDDDGIADDLDHQISDQYAEAQALIGHGELAGAFVA